MFKPQGLDKAQGRDGFIESVRPPQSQPQRSAGVQAVQDVSENKEIFASLQNMALLTFLYP